MAGRDLASETERAPDHDAPRRAAAPAKEAGATSAAAGAAPARAAAPDVAKSPDAASLGARQVKAKMVAGAASDPAEREADRAADHVMRMAAPEQNRPAAVDPTVADASSRGPGRATSVPSGPQRLAAPAAPAPAAPAPAAPAPAAPAPAAPAPAAPAPAALAPAAGAGPKAGGAQEPVRRQATADHDPHGGKEVPEETQRYLNRSQGTGRPLPDGTRRYFEARFSADFGGVRVHDDDQADRAARSIGALAFTRGSDIWFSAGTYDPVTDDGRRLLAHELAHIAQQYPGIGREAGERSGERPGAAPPPSAAKAPAADGPAIRRAPAPSKDKKDSGQDKSVPKGTIDTTKLTLQIDELPVPAWKAVPPYSTPPLRWRQPAEGRPNDQRSIWLSDPGLRGQAAQGVKQRVTDLKLGSPPYYLQGHATKAESSFMFVGSVEDIGAAIVIPPWDKDLSFHRFDVDHMKEWQLSGDNVIDNMWLLDSSANRSSGSTIKSNIWDRVSAFLADPTLANPPSFEDVRTKYTVTFGRLIPQDAAAPKEADSWTRDEIGKSKHVLGLEPVPDKKLADVKGSDTQLVIYQRAGGGQVRRIPLHGRTGVVSDWKGRGYQITSVTWDLDGASPGKGVVGNIKGTVLKDSQVVKNAELDVPIMGMFGVAYGGFVDREAISRMRRGKIEAKIASPVEFPDLDLDLEKGLIGRGVIPTPSISLLKNVEIAVVLEGGEIGVEADIAAPQLILPGPFKVKGGGLKLKGTTSGLSVEGQVDFEIQKVATGFVKAKKGTSTSFALDAELQFDKKMFDGDAKIKGSYEDGKWAVEGTLGVGPGKIKGIKKASAAVKVAEDTITADGEFETSLKGVDKGKLSFKYNQATGMEIAGEIILGKGIPGIKSGKLDATVKEGPTGHSLSGDVTIEPSVPGLTGTVTGKYEDGAFLVEADLGYEKGFAKGSVKVGLTNQAPGKDGKPAGPPKPDGSLTVYGGGTVTLTLTPWLEGTVGLKLTEQGEIEVSGEVALPSAFEVFKERAVEKQLLSIGIDIPIIGVAVAGQRIGIFATIRGGVSISAGFGPGQLRDVALKVTYNPARPDDTTVSGRGNFVVPAHAGLRLSVDGGLGAGIPVVSATAGITVFGEIGVAGAASAGVAITWTPRSGIVLDAKGEILVEPKFKFGVEAFVDVSADLLVTTIELYHHKWKLADFEYGSNLRFGLSLPIHYESGKPFDLSFDQIQWTYPHIEPAELLGGLMKQLVG